MVAVAAVGGCRLRLVKPSLALAVVTCGAEAQVRGAVRVALEASIATAGSELDLSVQIWVASAGVVCVACGRGSYRTVTAWRVRPRHVAEIVNLLNAFRRDRDPFRDARIFFCEAERTASDSRLAV